jgi:hypothetical protein
LQIPAQPGIDARHLLAGMEGLGSVGLPIQDLRTPETQNDNSHWLNWKLYRKTGWK